MIYSRLGNPTVAVLEERIATLEGGSTSPHHHRTITAPSLHHPCTITAPSLLHEAPTAARRPPSQGTITAPSLHHHRTVAAFSLIHSPISPEHPLNLLCVFSAPFATHSSLKVLLSH